MTKTWEKPKLVILVRSAPGERVLNACKTASGTGASSHNSGCYVEGAPIPVCGVRGDLLGIGNAIVCNVCSDLATS